MIKEGVNKRLMFYLAGVLLLLVVVHVPRDEAPVQYVDRHSGQLVTEKIPGERWLLWLYDNPAGELTLNALVKRKFVSEIYGRMMDRPSSVKKIAPFVREYDIDMSQFRDTVYGSFNDFFMRRLRADARRIDPDPAVLVSPADGKVLAYRDVTGEDFLIKGNRFDLPAFLGDTALARMFAHGSMFIIRLAPVDYHRFHYPVDGKVLYEKRIDGSYYSVNPLALRRRVRLLCENERGYTVIESDRFGRMVMAEVGATMVGSIVQTHRGPRVVKGEEKGFFRFGGSTVVLLLQPGRILIDEDLLVNTANGLETAVRMGERLGRALPAAAGAAAAETAAAEAAKTAAKGAAATGEIIEVPATAGTAKEKERP